MKTRILLLFLLFATAIATATVNAQPPAPVLPGAPTQAPVDGGLALLAAAGSAYAWRRLRSAEKP